MKKYIVFIAVLTALVSCSKKETTENTTKETESQNLSTITLTDSQLHQIDLEIIQIQNGSIPSTIRLNARTESSPEDRVSVSNVMGGFVKSIHFLPGSVVKKGQVLAVMEDPSYVQLQEDYLTTKTLLEQARLDFNRQKELNDSQAASTKVLEEANTQLRLLQIKKRAIEEKLQLIYLVPASIKVNSIKRTLNLIAPVSGVINEVFANKGQYVLGSEPIFEIIQSGNPLLNIKAFETNLNYLKVGQELHAFTNQNPDVKIIAQVVSITQHVNEDGSIDVLARIKDSQKMTFTTNMYFNVDLTTDHSNTRLVPISSIVHFEGKDYLFAVKNKNSFQSIAVELGEKNGSFIEVKTPLDNTQKYVGSGAYALLMAMKNTQEMN